MPQHNHADGVTDKNHVHASFIEQARGRIVVRCQAGDFLYFRVGARSLILALQEIGDGNFAVPRIKNDTHVGLRCRSLPFSKTTAEQSTGCSPVPYIHKG